MDTNLMIVGLVVLALIAAAAWLLIRKKESKNLEKNFGPEYNRTVEELGSRDKAEAELKARKKRVDQLHITPLAPAEAEAFSQSWRALQARFVDDPKVALAEADALVGQLMQKRGYPMGDFERRAADISVDHPAVVHHYRVAHDIARRGRDGDVDTETMRQAVIHYRALFSELLEVEEPRPAHTADTAAHSSNTVDTPRESDAVRMEPRDRKNMEAQS